MMGNNTTDNEIKLKPCPFCGGKAEIKYVQSGWSYENIAYIRCTKCGASSQHLNITYREKELTDKVIDLWNCRYGDGDYAFLSYTNGNFYTQQRPFFEKLKKIWAIIWNKDFYYSDIVLTKDDFKEFKEWVNRK